MSCLRRATRVVAVIGVILSSAVGLRAGRADDAKSATKANPTSDAANKAQHWEGSLKVRPGIELRVVLHVRGDDQGATVATLDSPDQGQGGFKLDPFSLSPGEHRLAFELKSKGAKYEGKLNSEGTEAVGTWSQGGAQLPLTFRQTKTPTPVAKIAGPEQAWEGKLSLGETVASFLVDSAVR